MSVEGDSATLDSVTKIVSAYLERSSGLLPEQVIGLVDGIFKVLLRDPSAATMALPSSSAGAAAAEAAPAPAEPKKPAVPVDESITPDYLVCLEDGTRVKLLKRYLRSKYDLTPRQYREKWGLAKDYPMVAPSYSAKRTAIAQASGLGARRPAPAAAPEPAPAAKPKRVRPAKAAAAPATAEAPAEAKPAKRRSRPAAPAAKPAAPSKKRGSKSAS